MMTKARTIVTAIAFSALWRRRLARVRRRPHAPINISTDSFTSLNSAAEQNHWNPQQSQKSLFWDQKGHWGLKLDLSQPVGRDIQLRDVQAGAYFHITPSIRVGGAVALGDSSSFDRTTVPQQQSQTPRVKLETNFKF